jgi:hypothetical protein
VIVSVELHFCHAGSGGCLVELMTDRVHVAFKYMSREHPNYGADENWDSRSWWAEVGCSFIS